MIESMLVERGSPCGIPMRLQRAFNGIRCQIYERRILFWLGIHLYCGCFINCVAIECGELVLLFLQFTISPTVSTAAVVLWGLFGVPLDFANSGK